MRTVDAKKLARSLFGMEVPCSPCSLYLAIPRPVAARSSKGKLWILDDHGREGAREVFVIECRWAEMPCSRSMRLVCEELLFLRHEQLHVICSDFGAMKEATGSLLTLWHAYATHNLS